MTAALIKEIKKTRMIAILSKGNPMRSSMWLLKRELLTARAGPRPHNFRRYSAASVTAPVLRLHW
jgi:hypothetical protein